MNRLTLTTLESREVPAIAAMSGSALFVLGDVATSNVVTLDPDPAGVRLTLNGVPTVYSGVNQVFVLGGNKADDISNNTSVAWTVLSGAGNDTILGGGVNDAYDTGAGNDVVYDLVGNNMVVSLDGQADRVFSNATSTVFNDAADAVTRFFAPGRTPGAGSVSLDGGVLYIAPGNAGSKVAVLSDGVQVYVAYNFNDGKGDRLFTAARAQVLSLAYFGGSGNDVYVNATNLSEASYGSGGNDVVVGGVGAFSLLKGSGGNDTLVGRASRNDISGNGGADTITAGAQTTLRTDAQDTLVGVGFDDLVVAS